MLKLRPFWRSKSGVAAVEFALLAPILIVLFFGAIELTDLLQRDQRVWNMASTTSDLAAQSTKITDADKNNIFAAATSIMYPYSTSGISIVMSSVIDNGSGGAKVAWSDAQNASPRAVGSALTVPAGVIDSGGSAIFTEVKYTFTPVLQNFFHKSWTFSGRFYSHPRRVKQVARTAS